MARILHVVTAPRAEGTPRLVLDWLTVKEHNQAVVFLSGSPPDLLGEFMASGAKIATGETFVRGPRKFWKMMRLVQREVRAFRPDLVVAWPMGFSHWVFLGARMAGSRAALLSHCGNPSGTAWPYGPSLTWICLWTTGLCGGRVVACSRYVKDRFREIPLVPNSLVGVAYNSVQTARVAERADAARRERLAGRVFRVVMVATLESHKDHATLIRAAALLRHADPAFEFLLAGQGALEQSLKALASELRVTDQVRFLGSRRDVPELLGQSDLFVLSTTPNEGRPGVILEALAAGVPIVASDVAPLREVLEDGSWGTLVPPGDADALARELLRVARSGPPDAARLTAGRAHAARFTPERMIADYLREGCRDGGGVAPRLVRPEPSSRG